MLGGDSETVEEARERLQNVPEIEKIACCSLMLEGVQTVICRMLDNQEFMLSIGERTSGAVEAMGSTILLVIGSGNRALGYIRARQTEQGIMFSNN